MIKKNTFNFTRRHSNDNIPHKMRLYGKVTDGIGVDEMRCYILTLYGTFLEY